MTTRDETGKNHDAGPSGSALWLFAEIGGYRQADAIRANMDSPFSPEAKIVHLKSKICPPPASALRDD